MYTYTYIYTYIRRYQIQNLNIHIYIHTYTQVTIWATPKQRFQVTWFRDNLFEDIHGACVYTYTQIYKHTSIYMYTNIWGRNQIRDFWSYRLVTIFLKTSMAPAWNPGIAAPPLLPLRCIVRACHVTRCGVLQYVAVCCSVNVLQCVLQCVIAMYCSSTFVAPLHGESVPCHMLQYVAVGSSVFQCQRVAICCSVLQCVMAVCCSVSLRCAAVALLPLCCFVKDCHVTRCSVLQCVAVCCSVSTLECVAV